MSAVAALNKILQNAAAELKNAGIETAGLDAAVLLCDVLKTDRAWLITHADQTLPEENIQLYKKHIRRRITRECVAYITGHKEFRGLDLTVTHDVLVPRADTETLVEAALNIIDITNKTAAGKKTISVLDLCTGSGAVAIALKTERPFIEVCASDISGAALSVTKQNAAKYNLLNENNKTADGASLRITQSDLFSNLNDKFDVIVSNPPYIPSALLASLAPEVQNEPRLALDGGSDGLGVIRRIIADAGHHLNSGGALLLEADSRQVEAVKALLEKSFYTNINILKDLAGLDRVITACVE
ncbi:release factor glutamine methyltransferase [Spirochaetia bacterium]|nr:release factor glutamine methyltransferase [Spirochaetia bacterium]